MQVKVTGQNIEKAIKILKREAEKEGLFKELKKRRYYEQPSEKRKSKQIEAQKKRAKSARFKFKGNYRPKTRAAS